MPAGRGSVESIYAEWTYLVCLVVVLRVVGKHFGLLGVLERVNELVGAEVFAPFLVVDEPGHLPLAWLTLGTGYAGNGHLLAQFDVEFPRPQKA